MTGQTAERVDPDKGGQAITAYHAKYFAHELTKRCASDNVEKLIGALSDIRATVDLNPHQIEAALFAFSSPLSKGAILADEVGLGKTIEAGLLLAQKWAEGQRKLLVIVPSNLRQQWSQEMADKFYLPSVILETRTFNEEIRKGNLNPFDQKNALVICSFQFAKKQEPYIKSTKWNLIVIDEAHRLRNVYKPTNKIANILKQATAPFQKVLLTATPLQNSLLELYGLVSLVDEYTFGDLKSFKAQFARLTGDSDFADLSGSEDLLYELLLKSGFSLTTKVEKIKLANKDVFSIENGALLLCLDREVTQELIDALAEANPIQVICLDAGFKGNDQLKTNAVQTFKSRAQSKEQEIVFRTV